jgi:hypothetical protein
MLGGGYGSAIGAMFGALIFGVVQMGIFYTGIDTDWFKAFMGAMLLAAVLFNDYTRRNVEMNAFYALRDTAGRIVLRERAEIVTGFDEFDDPLNDLSSLNDAVRRTTLQIADQIHTRVAVFLTEGTAPDMPAAKPAEKEPPTAVTPTGEPIGAWARKR